MEPLEWKPLSAFSLRAQGPEGSWIISGPLDYRGSLATIKFQRAKPDGEDHRTMMSKLDELEDWTVSEEGQRIWAHCSPSELGYAQNHFEAKMLIEMLRKGDDNLLPARDIIVAAGFELQHKFDNWRGHFDCYRHKKKTNLGFTLGDDSASLEYDRRNGWYNLFRLSGDYLNDHVRKNIIRTFYPDSVKDYQRIAASFAAWLLEERTKRGGRNFGGRPMV